MLGKELKDTGNIGENASVAASGSASLGIINLQQFRDFGISIKGTFSAAGTLTCNVYYSTDGVDWDTVAYATWNTVAAASGTLKSTKIIDVLPTGFIKVEASNSSGSAAITKISATYCFARWEDRYDGRTTARVRGGVVE